MKKRISVYEGEEITLSTMHRKELYLAPACTKILGANLFIPGKNINTDLLGTFSGEIERQKNQKESALEKCYLGLEISGGMLGIANEGSFGPHPYIPFIPSSLETLVFIDKRKGLKIFENMRFNKTNYQQQIVSFSDDLTPFLKSVLFPSHGLIVKPNIWDDKSILFKGVQDFLELKKSVEICCSHSSDNRAHIETDMRAHMNPTRGLNIRKVGIRLFRALASLCPACDSPGWRKTEMKKGRPCGSCDFPSELPIAHLWTCPSCCYTAEEALIFNGYTDPAFCQICNP